MSKVTFQCEICNYISTDPTVVSKREDGIIRCRVCSDKAKYGKFLSDQWLIDNQLPDKERDWIDYIRDLLED